jgi:hypothetical protein
MVKHAIMRLTVWPFGSFGFRICFEFRVSFFEIKVNGCAVIISNRLCAAQPSFGIGILIFGIFIPKIQMLITIWARGICGHLLAAADAGCHQGFFMALSRTC